MDKFWRGFNLAIGQNAIFGEDLIWRMMNFVKFGECEILINLAKGTKTIFFLFMR